MKSCLVLLINVHDNEMLNLHRCKDNIVLTRKRFLGEKEEEERKGGAAKVAVTV